MRAVVTRVKNASVVINEQVNGQIGTGFLVLLGVSPLTAIASFAAVSALFVLPTYPTLLAAVEISSTLFLPLLKTAGIAVVTRIGADLCRDAGESAVASAVEMAGAMGALLAVLPLMQAAWEVLRSLL